MSTNGFMQRRKGEELLRQRFENLLSTLKNKQKEAENSLRQRLEAETPVQQLRDETDALETQRAKLDARLAELREQVRHIEATVRTQVQDMTRELDAAVTALQARVRDDERALVEQLWVDSLSADLKDLLGKVPKAQELMSNGISVCLQRLALSREG